MTDDEDGEGQPEKYDGLYTGLVVDNADPLMSGRVKFTIPSMFEPSSPWARMGNGLGAGPRGFLMVPKIGDMVDVHFLMGDPKVPVYYAANMLQGGNLTHVLHPPSGYPAVAPQDSHLVWGIEGTRYAIQVDERPGFEYFRITDKLEALNFFDMDGVKGITSIGAKSTIAFICRGGSIAMGALNMSFNGRPLDNTTIDPV